MVASGLAGLGLSIHGSRLAFDGFGVLGVAGRRARDDFTVGAFSLGKARRVEVRVRQHRPGDELLAGIGTRPQGEHVLATRLGTLAVAAIEQLLGRARQDARRFDVLRKRGCELQRGLDRTLFKRRPLRLGQRRRGFVQRNQRGVAGTARLGCVCVVVRGLFILVGSLAVARAFEQQVGQQQSRRRRFRRRVEAVEVFAVPAHGGVAIGLARPSSAPAHGDDGQVEQVRLHGCTHARIDGRATLRPVRAARAVEFDQLLLRLEHERVEARLAVGIGRLAEQEWRGGIERLPARERTVNFGTVAWKRSFSTYRSPSALLQPRFVRRRPTLGECGLQRGRPFVRSEHQAQGAQGVVRQLLLRPRQLRNVAQLAVVHQHGVERARKSRLLAALSPSLNCAQPRL